MGLEDVSPGHLRRSNGLDGMKLRFGRSGDRVLDVRCLHWLVFELNIIEGTVVS